MQVTPRRRERAVHVVDALTASFVAGSIIATGAVASALAGPLAPTTSTGDQPSAARPGAAGALAPAAVRPSAAGARVPATSAARASAAVTARSTASPLPRHPSPSPRHRHPPRRRAPRQRRPEGE